MTKRKDYCRVEGSSSGRTPDSGSGSGGSSPPPSAIFVILLDIWLAGKSVNRFRRNRIVVNSAGSQSANGGSIPPCATIFLGEI